MSRTYTSGQLDREVQLLIHEQVVLLDQIFEEGAGIRALKIAPDSDYAQGFHPDYLADLSHFEIGKIVSTVERYVMDQAWSDSIPHRVTQLRYAVERVFSPVTIQGYEEEKLSSPMPDGVPEAFSDGAVDVDLGHFYQGILYGLLALAEARLKMDQSERLTMTEVALLIDVREATVVTNAHRKNFVSVEEDGRRYVEPGDVLPWAMKNGYKPTTRGGHASEPKPSISETSAYVVVPVAKDGVWFDPYSRHNGRYRIGSGRNERKFVDYYEALDRLMNMPSPRWQTKRNGMRGMAFAIRFDRVLRAQLDGTLAEINVAL